MEKGCGKSVVMDHGDNAVCGLPYWGAIYVCDKCRADHPTISRAALDSALHDVMTSGDERGPHWNTEEIIAALKICGVQVKE